MSALLAVAGMLAVAGLLVRAAFRCGRRHRAAPLPPPLLRELSEHKRRCLGEPPARVDLELELLFGVGAGRPPGPHGVNAQGSTASRAPGLLPLGLPRRLRLFRRSV